jgi:hypothetical protein
MVAVIIIIIIKWLFGQKSWGVIWVIQKPAKKVQIRNLHSSVKVIRNTETVKACSTDGRIYKSVQIFR